MNRCVCSRGSSAVKRFKFTNRLYATSSNSPEHGNESISSVAATEQVVDQHTNERSIGAQESQDGSVPYKRRPLPLSPLMDPDLIAAREKWQLPKAPPSKTPTPFQQQLAKNPYARALATPIRRCQVTQHLLPRFFLQDFNVIAHPNTGEPFWLPRSLTTKVTKQSIQDSTPMLEDNEAGKDEPFISEAETEALEPLTEPEIKSPIVREAINAFPKDTPKIGPNVYTLARRQVLESMQDKSSGNGHKWEKFGGPRMKMYKRFAKVRESTSWRHDMDTFVLELMRRRTVESLVACVQMKRGYVIPCSGWEDAKAKPQAGAILWCRPVELKEEGEEGPPEFATLVMGKAKLKKVPVHNIQVLLGDEHLDKLREKLPRLLDKGLMAVRHRGATIDLQMRLWRLQGYVAEHIDS